MGGVPDDDFVERIAAAVAARLGVSPPAVPALSAGRTVTWEQLWESYAPAERGKLASWDTVMGRAGHVLRILGKELVVDANVHTVRRYREQRSGETTIRKGLTSPATRNREIELITRMARWGSRQKPPVIPLNPFDGVPRDDLFEAVENIRRNVIEDDPDGTISLAQLLNDATPFEGALVLCAHSSGMRRGEMAVLERTWIDRSPGEDGHPIRIVEIPPGVSKGRRGHRPGRWTFISSEALEAVDQYTETLPFPWRYRSPYVFVNRRTGGHLSAGHFTVTFTKIAERCGAVGPSGPPWLHDCRRSFITLARRRGEDTSNIMQASGHRTLAAFKRYDIHSRQDAIAVRARIEAARRKDLDSLELHRRPPRRAADNVGGEKINPMLSKKC